MNTREGNERLIAQNDDPELLEWLANAERNGGGFISRIAGAALRADDENYLLLRPAVVQLRAKYTEYEPSEAVKQEVKGHEDFFSRFERTTLPMIKNSTISIAVSGEDRGPDAKLCLEMGAAVLLDKPIILLIAPGTPVPANAKRCASSIIEGHADDPVTQKRLHAAITEVLDKDERARRRPS